MLKHQFSKYKKQAQREFEECNSRKQSKSLVLRVLGRPRNKIMKQNPEKLISIILLLHLRGRQIKAIRGGLERES